MIDASPILGAIKGAVQVNRASQGNDQLATSLVIPNANIQKAFRPVGIRDRLNQRSAPVREGMRITLELLKAMDTLCRENGAQFAVVVIPTKESVFADYVRRNREMRLRNVIEDLIANEEAATKALVEFLDHARIPHLETLPALRRQASHQLYTRSDRDMHPGKNGYRVIGETVATFVEALGKRRSQH